MPKPVDQGGVDRNLVRERFLSLKLGGYRVKVSASTGTSRVMVVRSGVKSGSGYVMSTG